MRHRLIQTQERMDLGGIRSLRPPAQPRDERRLRSFDPAGLRPRHNEKQIFAVARDDNAAGAG
jgi:hypothetical protein